jgi:hypothetical protein
MARDREKAGKVVAIMLRVKTQGILAGAMLGPALVAAAACGDDEGSEEDVAAVEDTAREVAEAGRRTWTSSLPT